MRALLEEFRPGRTIYFPGAGGEPSALIAALRAEPDRLRSVHLVSCLIPGFNTTDYTALEETTRLTTFLLPPALRDSFAAGRVRLLPLSYTGIAAYLGERLTIDVAIAHVAPPGPDGRCSLGIAADFTPLVWPRAKRRIALVNPTMPSMRRGPSIRLDEADVVVSSACELFTAPAALDGTEASAIAATVAALVPAHAHLQLGIGAAPSAVWRSLAGRWDITLASGLVAEPFIDWGRPGAHKAGVAYGSKDFYRFLAESDLVTFASVTETHSASVLSGLDRFTAINSAIEVDLFGQVNSETQGGRLMSGAGGAPDFVRAALRSHGGRSIIALPATAGRSRISRIVPVLSGPIVSLGRDLADTVVTEYGVAELRNRSIDERAEALISIAAPDHRDGLAEDWRGIRASL